jgi:hypothetical protein
MDNQVKPVRLTSLESLMGNVRDTFLIGMSEHMHVNDATIIEKKLVLKFKKPIENLGHDHKEISTFDTDKAREFG